MDYKIGQRVKVTKSTHNNYIKGDEFIIHNIEGNHLFNKHCQFIHRNYVEPVEGWTANDGRHATKPELDDSTIKVILRDGQTYQSAFPQNLRWEHGNKDFPADTDIMYYKVVKPAPTPFYVGQKLYDKRDGSQFTVASWDNETVYSNYGNTNEPTGVLRGRKIEHVSMVKPATPWHDDTERMDWLGKNIDKFAKALRHDARTCDARELIDTLRYDALAPVTEPDRLTRIEMRLNKLEGKDNWIPWSGGFCPVPPDTPITIRLRNGREINPKEPQYLRWAHTTFQKFHDTEIIAYKVL